MTDSDNQISVDWRVIFGMVLTTAWITAGFTYLMGVVGWGNFIHLPTGSIGSFLEGAFAPLAFLWLVIGHFMQQKEITANTKAITLQEKSARRLELHSRRDSYFKLLGLVQDQLGSIAGFHYISVFGDSGTGKMTFEEFSDHRAQTTSGDHAYFIRLMTIESFSFREDPEAIQDMYFGTDVRTRHTNNYVKTFEKLLNSAREIDQDDMISNALLHGSAAGRQYRVIKLVQGGDAEELDLYL